MWVKPSFRTSLKGNLPSSTLVSCRHRMSGSSRRTNRATISMRKRTELMFHVETLRRLGAGGETKRATVIARMSGLQTTAEVVELLEGAITDLQLAPLAAMIDGHLQ